MSTSTRPKPPEYDGHAVEDITVKLTADLSAVAFLEGRLFHFGEEAFVLVRAKVRKVAHVPPDLDYPEGPLKAAFDLAGMVDVSFIDAELAAELMEEQRRRNDENRGTPQLPLDVDPETGEISDAEWEGSDAQLEAADQADLAELDDDRDLTDDDFPDEDEG